MTLVPASDRIGSAWRAMPHERIEGIIRSALDEDIGNGDITTAITIEANRQAQGRMITRESGIAAGLDIAQLTFQLADPMTRWVSDIEDGRPVEPGTILGTCEGPVAAILSAERVVLNLIQRMSGIATLTASFVSRVAHTQARILDTRKTVPGLRLLDKYAVVCGGGYNHRFGLSDGILIKDNHIAAAGGVASALEVAQARRPHGLRIEIEVESLHQIQEALAGGAEIILLDNMSTNELQEAVGLIDGRALTEASGGVSLDSVRAVAETGVDLISIGRLTHSPPALDISLEIAL